VRQRQHHADVGVAHDERHPIGRETDVQRHVCCVDLEYGQHADVGVHGVVEQQPDPVT
jgi:hypothetical protein